MAKVSKEILEALQAKTPANVNEAMARYCALMQEIKDRTDAIGQVLSGKLALHSRIGVELAYLQLRMVCELIALASVMAHGDFGVALTAKIRDEDRPGKLLKMLADIHHDSYPRPFKQIHDRDGEIVSWEDIHTGFLTRDELPKLYGLCGNELHQGDLSKVGRFPKIEKSFKEIQSWHAKIVHLLGSHKIKLYNSTSEIWVGMEEKTHKKVYWGFMLSVSRDELQLARSKLSSIRRSKSSKPRSSARNGAKKKARRGVTRKGAKGGQRGARGRS